MAASSKTATASDTFPANLFAPKPNKSQRSGLRASKDERKLSDSSEVTSPDSAESDRRTQRHDWREAMHLSAPKVSWRAIEIAAQDAERTRRNGLVLQRNATSAPPPSQSNQNGPTATPVTTATPIGTGMKPGAMLPISGLGYWQEIGSRNQAGHTRCGVYTPEQNGTRTLYVGSDEGGVWSADQFGVGWTHSSHSVYGGADEVLFLPGLPAATPPLDQDALIFRQGERIYTSQDGGQIWNVGQGFDSLPGKELNEFLTLQVLPDGANTLLGLVRLTLTAGGGETWVVRSIDQGANFELLWLAPETGRGDLWIPAAGPEAGTGV